MKPRAPDLFTFNQASNEAHARRTDPETSHAAARSVKNIGASQRKILWQLQNFGPMTDDQIYPLVARYMSPSGARTRRSELVAMKPAKVKDSGKRRTGTTGRKMTIWEAV